MPTLNLNIYFMLHIPCPHCGPRNETEFHYGAEAVVAYPSYPNSLNAMLLLTKNTVVALWQIWCLQFVHK
jgi:Sarcosine oxidase, delta subunit family